MRIAVVGAGFCGLAVAYFLGKLGHSVEIFDGKGIGGGASGIAAGLMHPFAGRFANLNFRGHEGMAATKQLLEISSQTLGRPVAEYNGLLRFVTTKEQEKTFGKCAKNHEEVIWKNSCSEVSSEFLDVPGIIITTAIKINCPEYLKGLWLSCKNAVLHLIQVNHLDELKNYDRVVITTGAFRGLTQTVFNQVKGHILEYSWPWDKSLPLSINSQVYLMMGEGNRTVIAGSTFEKDFDRIEADYDVAVKEIDSRAKELYPRLADSKIIGCRAGLRASTKDHLPVIEQMDRSTWTLTGMGSKGLLYHALYSKELTERIISS